MGRLISLDQPGTQRQRLRRTIAESLNLLMKKATLDDDARDLAALIVFCLREISQNIESSASVWDKRHYYIKADELRREWEWASRFSERMTRLIRVGDWVRLPVVLADLAPRFADIRIAKVTRGPELWQGAYERLRTEGAPPPQPV